MASYKIEDMSCAHCVSTIEAAVKRIDPTATVRADLDTKLVEITSTSEPAKVQAALTEVGYEAEPVTG